MKRTQSSTRTAPKPGVRISSPCEAVSRHASANFWCAVSRRTRPSAGVAGPLAGLNAFFAFAFGSAAFLVFA